MAVAARLCPAARWAGSEVRRGPRAGPGGGRPDSTPSGPFLRADPREPPREVAAGSATVRPERQLLVLPHICPLAHLRLGGRWTAPALGVKNCSWAASLLCSLLIRVKRPGFAPCLLTEKGPHDLGVRVHLKRFELPLEVQLSKTSPCSPYLRNLPRLRNQLANLTPDPHGRIIPLWPSFGAQAREFPGSLQEGTPGFQSTLEASAVEPAPSFFLQGQSHSGQQPSPPLSVYGQLLAESGLSSNPSLPPLSRYLSFHLIGRLKVATFY